MNRFWHRRITEATMFVSLAIVLAFAVTKLGYTNNFTRLFSVELISAVIAGSTFLLSLLLYFKVPKKDITKVTFLAYAMLVVSVASIIITTGESNSPFIGFWIGVSVFAGVFGWRGFALILLLVAAYSGYGYFQQVTTDSLIIASIASLAPLVASYIIWHSKSGKDAEHSKAYNELATELSHEANKSETVIGAINDGVVFVDKQGVIQLINPAAQRIIGWGQNDAIGLSYKSVVKLLDANDKPLTPATDPVEQVLSTNQEVHSEDFSVETEGGKKILLSIIVSPIGKPSTGAIMVFRDMTKEKAEEREQAEFISTASHEMRTPVASIEGYLGLALNPATATIDDKAREYILKAHASAEHLGRLFQDLLDVSKAQDGRMANKPSVVDVVEFVGMVAEGLKPKAIEKGLRFMYKPRPDGEQSARKLDPVYYAHVDNDHFREVVSNLVENAIKYTPHGDVVIDVTGDDTHVSISVQDSGIGIPTEDIPHLFQKFYRVDNSDTREIGGTGLGLFLCRRLTEIMGGQIKVASQYKKGSTFTLDLPRIDHQEAERLIEAATTAQELTTANKPEPAAPTPPTPLTPTIQLTVPEVHPPVTAPIVAPLPTTVTTYPVPVTPAQSAHPQTVHLNVPITQIENSPHLYVAPRPGVRIPVRNSTDATKQP